jgi:tetratricopeptide (TPR) repeat protein
MRPPGGAEWILSGAEIAPADPQPSAAASAFSVEDAIAAAERAYAAGDFQLVLDRFEQALGGILERHPHNFPPLLGRAELLVHCGDHGKAVHWYRLALEHRPDNISLLRTLASCLLNAGQPEAATAPLQTGLRLDPHNGQLLSSFIDLCRRCGDLPHALDASSRLLALYSASAWRRQEAAGPWPTGSWPAVAAVGQIA